MALSFMNITEKILARASEKNTVSPDDIVFAKVDKVMVHDVSGPGVLKVFDKLQKAEDFDKAFENLNQTEKDIYNSKIKPNESLTSQLLKSAIKKVQDANQE